MEANLVIYIRCLEICMPFDLVISPPEVNSKGKIVVMRNLAYWNLIRVLMMS